MAKHTGRGIAAIEYPTGMNQNGDPSQCWIKVKPDGRVDVFAGTADIGNGSKTIQSQIVAETIGVPYDWITYDNSNTDSSPVCTGTFASRATFVAGKAAEKAALQVKQKILEIAGKEMEIDPADLEIIDGEVIAKGAPQTKLGVGDVAAAATWGHGELITGTGAQLKPYAEIIDPETGKVDLPPHSAISYASCSAEVEVDDETGEVRVTHLKQCYDVGRALARRRADRGWRNDGPRARHPRKLLPVLPARRASRRRLRLVPRAGHGGHAADRHDHDREPLRRRALRREGHR
jgi:CO/xanthine dehydrogenase Mo-binding subunit